MAVLISGKSSYVIVRYGKNFEKELAILTEEGIICIGYSEIQLFNSNKNYDIHSITSVKMKSNKKVRKMHLLYIINKNREFQFFNIDSLILLEKSSQQLLYFESIPCFYKPCPIKNFKWIIPTNSQIELFSSIQSKFREQILDSYLIGDQLHSVLIKQTLLTSESDLNILSKEPFSSSTLNINEFISLEKEEEQINSFLYISNLKR